MMDCLDAHRTELRMILVSVTPVKILSLRR